MLYIFIVLALVYFFLFGLKVYLCLTDNPKPEEIFVNLTCENGISGDDSSLSLFISGKNIFGENVYLCCCITDENNNKKLYDFKMNTQFRDENISLVLSPISLNNSSKNLLLSVKLYVTDTLSEEDLKIDRELTEKGYHINYAHINVDLKKFFKVNTETRIVKKENFTAKKILNFIFLFFPKIEEYYYSKNYKNK